MAYLVEVRTEEGRVGGAQLAAQYTRLRGLARVTLGSLRESRLRLEVARLGVLELVCQLDTRRLEAHVGLIGAAELGLQVAEGPIGAG